MFVRSVSGVISGAGVMIQTRAFLLPVPNQAVFWGTWLSW